MFAATEKVSDIGLRHNSIRYPESVRDVLLRDFTFDELLV